MEWKGTEGKQVANAKKNGDCSEFEVLQSSGERTECALALLRTIRVKASNIIEFRPV